MAPLGWRLTQGQFLWIEQCNPDIHLLDPFVQFVLSQKQDFIWDDKQILHNLMNYNKNIQEKIITQTRDHIYLNSASAYTKLQQQA